MNDRAPRTPAPAPDGPRPPGGGPGPGDSPGGPPGGNTGQPAPQEDIRVEQPGKLLRLAMMVRETLEEVRRAPLDEGARERLQKIHGRVIDELKNGLSGALAEELERITVPVDGSGIPSDAELRIAQAQLLGWLEGLFQGIQAAIATQQLAAQAQLEEIRRRGLPPGRHIEAEAQPGDRTPGQYL